MLIGGKMSEGAVIFKLKNGQVGTVKTLKEVPAPDLALLIVVIEKEVERLKKMIKDFPMRDGKEN